MSTEINDKLDEILARAEAATAAPWCAVSKQWVDGVVPLADRFVITEVPVINPVLAKMAWNGDENDHLTRRTIADQTFIAAARTDVPALVKALQSALEYVAIRNPISLDQKEVLADIATILNAALPPFDSTQGLRQTTGAVPAEEDVTP